MWCQAHSARTPVLVGSLSLFSHFAIFPHAFAAKSCTFRPASLSLSLRLARTLCSYLSLWFLSTGNKNNGSEMSIVVVTSSGLNRDQFTEAGNMRVGQRGVACKLLLKGWRGHAQVELWVLCICAATTRKTSDDNEGSCCCALRGYVAAAFFFIETHCGNLNSCFVHYVALLLPRSHGCHGLLSRSFFGFFFRQRQKPLRTQRGKTLRSFLFMPN